MDRQTEALVSYWSPERTGLKLLLNLTIIIILTPLVLVLFQVGGAYSYDCSFGYIPNVELMKFISLATFGSYLPSCPKVDLNSQEMNAYHKAFLTYSFLKTPESMNSEYFCGEFRFTLFLHDFFY